MLPLPPVRLLRIQSNDDPGFELRIRNPARPTGSEIESAGGSFRLRPR